MASYEDITKETDGLLYMAKFNSTNNEKSAFKLWNLTFNSAPRKGVKVSHNWNRSAKTSDLSQADKSKSSVAFTRGDAAFQFVMNNDNWEKSVGGPLVEGDWGVDGSFKYIDNMGKKFRKVETGLEISSPDMDGTKLKVNIGLEHQTPYVKPEFPPMKPAVADAKAVQMTLDECKDQYIDYKGDETVVKFDAAVENGDITAGLAYEKNMQNYMEDDKIEVAASVKNGDNRFWGGYEHGAGAKVGGLFNFPADKWSQAVEVRWHMFDEEEAKKKCDALTKRYNAQTEKKGSAPEQDKPMDFMGQGFPVTIATGGKHKLSDKTTLAYAVELGNAAHAQMKATHAVDSNWTVSVHQSYDQDKEQKQPYFLGFDVAYKL